MAYNKVIQVFWYPITSQALPFPTSRAISTLPPGDGAVIGANVDYNDPKFSGIYITSNGQSGGNARWIVTFTAAFIGKKIKAYINFGNNWYVYEIDVWGLGSWTIVNPGSGPAVPNQIIFGNPVNIFDDFEPAERDPNHPPPVYNPFEPIVIIEPQGSGPCSVMDNIKVTLITPANLVITQVVIYRDGIPYPVPLADLLAGYLFAEPGEYEMVIFYSYQGNPTETLVEYFTILGEAYPYVQAERTYGGVIYAQTPVVFDNILLTNGTIDCDTLNGQINIYLCGQYFIKWFVVPQLGLTTDGIDFSIISASAQEPQGSGHVKVSAASGFAVVEALAVPYTVQLFNTSDGEIALSDFTQATAGLVIVKIGDVDNPA